jgi:serine/threonine protein kinase
MVSLCNAVAALHGEGKLHLDINPSNIWLFPYSNDTPQRVALLDFDTVLKLDDKNNAPVALTSGWAAPELANYKKRAEKHPY